DGACGHDECQECHSWIREQLESGNEWAWFCARVVARWNGFEGDDYLGCCSYASGEEFCRPGGYYDDMKARALEDLNRAVSDAVKGLDVKEFDGETYVSGPSMDVGDYAGSGSIGLANIRWFEEHQPDDVIVEHGDFDYRRAWVRITPDNVELLRNVRD